MCQSRILILSIAFSAFFSGLILVVFQNFQANNSDDLASICDSNSALHARIEWVEEIELSDEEKCLEFQGDFYTRIETFLPQVQSVKIAYAKYVICKAASNQIRATGPHIYLLDQVFLI